MLTGSIVISGPGNVLEPTMPGTTTIAQVTISLTQFSYGDSGSVHWATEVVAGGATPGQDYVADSGTVNLSFTNTSVYVNVPILYDSFSEGPEEFRVVLSSPTGSLGIMVGSCTITIGTGYGPPPPPPDPPPTPTVSFASSTSEPMFEGDTRELHLVRNMTGPALTVYFVIAADSVAKSSDVTLTPAGSVTFAEGETGATFTLTAIDDAAIEVHEVLKLSLVPYPAPNQGPAPYIVGNPSDAVLQIYDNNEAIFSDLTVDWLAPDDSWVNSSDTEMLWQEDDLRWTVTLPPEEIPFASELSNLKLLKRPHDNPAASWEELEAQSMQPNPDDLAQFFIYADPLVGDWDITARGVFGAAVTAWLFAPKHYAETAIHSTEWVVPTYDPGLRLIHDPDDVLWMDPLYYGPRIYPEYTLPPDHVTGQSDHTLVDVEVTLAMAPPPGFSAVVYMRSFDPDHEFNPSSSSANFTLDPNDSYQSTPQDLDNRFGSVVTGGGGFLLNDQISFAAGQAAKTNPFKILAIQPGNNFNVGATIHQAWANTPYMHLSFTNRVAIEGVKMTPAHSTEVLTVWRTLHVERDSMGEPDPIYDLFDPTPAPGWDDPEPTPWDVRDADIGLLAESFRPANIDVSADLQAYDITDGWDIDFFARNVIDEADVNASAEDMRDVRNNNAFWTVQVIGAYEFADEDFDHPDKGTTFGILYGADEPFALVFLEAIRDRAAFAGSVDYPVTFGSNATEREMILDRRTVVHEVAHAFLGYHFYINTYQDPTHPSNYGIMNIIVDLFGTPQDFRFEPEQLGIIQSQLKPHTYY
jgi:hypothetical protein